MTTPPDPSPRGSWPPPGEQWQQPGPPGGQWQQPGPPGGQWQQPAPPGGQWPPTGVQGHGGAPWPAYGSPPAPPARPVSWLARGLGGVILLCGALMVVGAFLTWGVGDLGGKENFTTPGTAGDGRFTAIFGAIVVLAGAVRLAVARRGVAQLVTGIVAAVASALVTVVAVLDAVDISDPSRDHAGLVSMDLYVGSGLWLTLVAGIVGMLAAVAALVRRT